MQTTDLGYGNGLWLDAPAAASLWRINGAIGRRLDINEAGRTWAQQNRFRQDYLNGVPGAAFALPPGTSIHEQGRAVDTDDRFIDLMADHGWFRTALARNEPWHFEYDESRDNHSHETAAGGSSEFPTPVALPDEEDDMLYLNLKMPKGNTHVIAVDRGLLRHFIQGDPMELLKNLDRSRDDWQEIPFSAFPALCRTKGIDLEGNPAYRVNADGSLFEVLNPLTGKYGMGNVWMIENARYADTLSETP